MNKLHCPQEPSIQLQASPPPSATASPTLYLIPPVASKTFVGNSHTMNGNSNESFIAFEHSKMGLQTLQHTMLMWAVLVTSLARVAKESVLRDCSTWLWAGLIVQIMAVLALPPSECCKIRVSFESLYGMCAPFVLLPALHANNCSKIISLDNDLNCCCFKPTI
jgi:hypothetical protein